MFSSDSFSIASRSVFANPFDLLSVICLTSAAFFAARSLIAWRRTARISFGALAMYSSTVTGLVGVIGSGVGALTVGTDAVGAGARSFSGSPLFTVAHGHCA